METKMQQVQRPLDNQSHALSLFLGVSSVFF